ncbi:MAG: glycosyltransferase [Terracidiphilus sp.]
MTRRPTVLFVIPHLGGGGAERITFLLASHLAPHKFDLHLAILAHAQHEMAKDEFPSQVKVHIVSNKRVRESVRYLLRLVWQLRPRIILSNMAHLNFVVLLLRPVMPLGTRIIVRQNGTISRILSTCARPAWTRFLYRRLYPRAHRIVCQSPEMADDLSSLIRVTPHQVVILHNPVDDASMHCLDRHTPSKWHGPGPHLLAISRLAAEKGIDMLLQAIAELRAQYPSIDATILGQGPEEQSLKQLSRTLGLDNTVRFAGYEPRPSAYFPHASLLVVASRHEGMPNAMLEAAAAGLPLVSTPASPAITRLLSHRPGGWLATDCSAPALAKAISKAVATLQPGQRFTHEWIEPFRLRNAIKQYESLLDSLI